MKVHLECLPDEALAVALGVGKKNIKHHAGNGRVCASLEKLEGKIGFIDEEPGKPQANHRFLKELTLVKEEFGVKEWIDRKRNHKVLMICPELEGWIIKHIPKKNLEQFGLPTNAKSLHGIIISRLKNFSDLIDDQVKKKNRAILHLKDLLNS